MDIILATIIMVTAVVYITYLILKWFIAMLRS